MTGLLICAAVVMLVGWFVTAMGGCMSAQQMMLSARIYLFLGLALIAVALWLAYAAGGA